MARITQPQKNQVFQTDSIQLAHRAFNLVSKYVFNEDNVADMSPNMSSSISSNRNNSNSNKDVESKAWGRSMKSAVVFELAYRDFELAVQKDSKNLFILIWYAICMYWNTRYAANSEKLQVLDAKATELFGKAISNCKVKVITDNTRDSFLKRLFLSTSSSSIPSITTTMSAFTLSKADILATWADVLHRESRYREGWVASVMLQSAVEKAQAAYELHPDKNNQYSSIFVLWHKILIDQEKLLNQGS